ncbi:MAG TPA: Rieske 2Fe-2S domain-containing protein [Dehalococcoidia bacterium]|nr:Rieske 2Fe-2S domain-containing protein [Dehalococcoidia bacterium]
MLSVQENEYMCRVGPGTPMGNFIRQYWIPALMPSELPTADCPPVRLRLLGENLIGFRTTSGAVGIIQNACPHRGASMFFGRNEEEGLRCVYHGWKFDVTGACIDMPSEPSESNFKNKVRTRAYPCIERNGIIFTYMGQREAPPPLPDLLPNLDEECRVDKTMRECNFLQALEGDIDTVHLGFLHAGHRRLEDAIPGTEGYYTLKTRNVSLEVTETPIGTTYGGYRPAEDDSDYWRIACFQLPFYTIDPTGLLGLKTAGKAWVPLDDNHMMLWNFTSPTRGAVEGPGVGGLRGQTWTVRNQPQAGFQGAGYLPDSTDWLGKFRSIQDAGNDYRIDRNAQSAMESYTGIQGIPEQDKAMNESMGPIMDRSLEHLGTTDQMVIRTRRRLISAAKAFEQTGNAPEGVEQPELYRQRAGCVLLPRGINALEACADLLFGRSLDIEAANQMVAVSS